MRIHVMDLADGDQIEQPMLVRDKQVRTNRNGQQYLQLDLLDRTGSISARFWNATDDDTKSFEAGDFVDIRGKAQVFQGQLQLILTYFRRRDPGTLDLGEFVPSTPKDVNVLLADLRAGLAKVRQPHLQALVQAFLADTDLMSRIMRAPAGVRHHHAYVGGLLEHIVSISKVYDRIADLYPELDPDLMRLGIFLHDLGKLRELHFDRDFSYSDEGQLIGHLVLGVEMLNEKLREAEAVLGSPTPKHLSDHLKHLILSHHGTYEYGSPRLPMTCEAVALHYLDNLDAKVHNFAKTIHDDMHQESRWTAYDARAGRRLYKGPAPVKSPDEGIPHGGR